MTAADLEALLIDAKRNGVVLYYVPANDRRGWEIYSGTAPAPMAWSTLRGVK